jgi:hypothetical protein
MYTVAPRVGAQFAAQAPRTTYAGIFAVLLGTITVQPAFAQDGQPLNSIDWLSRSVMDAPSEGQIAASGPTTLQQGNQGSRAVVEVPLGEPAVATAVGVETVSMAPIGAPVHSETLGLLPSSRTGLPPTLWGETPEPLLADLLKRERLEMMPALQSLMFTLMLAELDPPKGASIMGQSPGQSLFLARIDRLLELGALEPAHAMLQLAGPTNPARFRRLFDISLLLGEEDRACELMTKTSGIAPSISARIFCLARTGDWSTAQVLFSSAKALNDIPAAIVPLLERFMDDEMVDTADDLAPPTNPTPLVFRMMEAIGQPMPTTYLPLAFAQADLGANTGWKSRLDAGERLAKAGTIDPNQMLGLYTEHAPAASGGVWERARAVAALDKAVQSRDPQAVTLALEPAVTVMEEAELEMVLAALYGEALVDIDLTGRSAAAAFRLGLLSQSYEIAAKSYRARSQDDALMIGIAKGSTAGLRSPDTLGKALKGAFDSAPIVPERYRELIEANRLGEAILRAIDDINEGARGGVQDVTDGLILLRAAGLEDVARQTALQLMLLERRG